MQSVIPRCGRSGSELDHLRRADAFAEAAAKERVYVDLVRWCVERAPRRMRHRVGGARGGLSWWPAAEKVLVRAARELKERRWAKGLSLARALLVPPAV